LSWILYFYNSERECETYISFEDLEQNEKNLKNINLTLITDSDIIVLTSKNNFIKNNNFIQLDLKNCETIFQKYFNINFYIIDIFRLSKIIP